MTEATTEAKTIAAGGQPRWEKEFQHPEHGPLTFVCKKLPTGLDWLRLAAVQEEIAPGVTQGGGVMLAEAIAGLMTVLDRPVLSEERDEDEDNPEHVKITRIFYDPVSDPRWEFPMVVWGAFQQWRYGVLSEDTQEQVKNSSGATSGSATAASSPSDGASLPSTPASAS